MITETRSELDVEGLRLVPPEDLAESPTNPRKDFGDLGDLAESIRNVGILQPLLAREVSGRLELVFGHRRLRAARQAGLELVPVNVRALKDLEVAELQLCENLQRKDLKPLEFAAGLKELHEKHGVAVEDLADRVHKSKATVYATLKLNELGPAGRKLLEAGTISFSIAVLLARIPNEKVQAEAAKALGPDVSYREAADLIQRDFMLELKNAHFDPDDAGLVPSAGACTKCPKTTGAQPELFADVKGADICTDLPCFRKKEDAAWALAVTAGETGTGPKTLTAAEAKQTFNEYNGAPEYDAPFVKLDRQCPEDEKCRTYGQLLGKSAKAHLVLGRNHKGEIVELLPKEGLKKLLDEVGKIKRREHVAAPHLTKEAKEKREAEDRKLEVRKKVVRAAVSEIAAALEEKELSKKLWLLLAKDLFGDGHGLHEVIQRRVKDADDQKAVKAYGKSLESVSEGQLRAFVVEAVLERSLYDCHAGYSDTLKELSGMCGVELKGLEAEAKAADKAPAKSGKIKKGTCRSCGCVEENACPGGCSWADKSETLCTACVGA